MGTLKKLASVAALMASQLMPGGLRQASAHDLLMSVELSVSAFPSAPLYSEQTDSALLPALTLTASRTLELAPNTEFVGAIRLAAAGEARRDATADITEGYLAYRGEGWTARGGVLMEQWGTLNAWRPVNQFNQIDQLADFEGDLRLGQPGVAVGLTGDNWNFTVFGGSHMPARRMGERGERFRPSELPLGSTDYEGGKGRPTLAARLQWRRDNIELAVSHLDGHSREPEFEVEMGTSGPHLRPSYRLIAQTGLESQIVVGDYIARGELAYRTGQSGGDFTSFGAGLERLFYGLFDNSKDLLVYVEGYRDNRRDTAPITAFNKDVAAGAKLIFNDAQSTEIDLRLLHDLEVDSTLLDLNAKRRIWKNTTIGFKLRAILNAERDRALQSFRKDSEIGLSLTRYF